MRKVAYLTPLYFATESCVGGGERYPLNLAKGVVRSARGGYQVDLLSFGPSSREIAIEPGVRLRVLTAARPPENPLDVLSWELPEALAGVDLVHIHQAYTRCSEVGILVARQLGKPICVTDHGGQTSTLGQQLGAIDLVDHVIPYSDFGASLFRTSAPITVIKGGVDTSYFQPPTPSRQRDRFLFLGRIMPHKGIDVLISALPDDLLLTVSGPVYHETYFARLQELARGKRVEFIPTSNDPQILDLCSRSWATILPSVYQDCYGTLYLVPELMGFTLIESMACGTPAICSRVGGMPEFIRHGATGFVCDTPDELTDCLRRLASDPELVERMGQQARRVTEQEYDLEVAGTKMRAVYDALIDRRARGQEVAA